MRRLATLLPLLALLLGACIKDDIPYPHIQPNITAIEVAHQQQPAAIDSARRLVTLFLSEAADITDVRITELALTPGAQLLDSMAVVSGINLTDTATLTLHLYYDWQWQLAARQTIERTFRVENQVGASVIDPQARTVHALVPTSQPLTDVHVDSIKLGGPAAQMSPDLRGATADFTRPLQVTVTEHGRSDIWTITVDQTDIAVDITRVDPWTRVAWVYISAEAGRTVTVDYRADGVDPWTPLPAASVTTVGGATVARISGLQPESTYQVRATAGDDATVPVTFTTRAERTLPDADFTRWWLDGAIWCPWTQGGDPFWGTGNKGAATLGQSNTTPIADPASPTGYRGARLESKFVGISILGKLAAGNLFAGTYVATEGTNGILAFGRPFDECPTRLTGRISYTSATISHSSADFTALRGRPDTCIVWCALGDWDQPYEIRTNPSNRHLFDPDDPGVIAYGQMQSGESTDGFIDIDIPLAYRSTQRRPRYLLVVASASKYGDYFTGGNGSVLLVDHFALGYDY